MQASQSAYSCVYVTSPSDTLTSIALQYRIRPIDLLLNNEELAMTYNLLSVLPQGTRISVPCTSGNTTTQSFTPCTYLFTPTDTLENASNALGVPRDDLLYYQSNGQPQVGSIVTATGCFNSNNNTYITRRGDTLQSIAAKYSVPVSSLILLNSIMTTATEQLPAGQTLVIPRV